MSKTEDSYLGDGVYASFDGYTIILDLRGQDSFTRIALEPIVIEALNRYSEKCFKQGKAMKTCSKCKGKGSYFYDHNHAQPCEQCCLHDKGWWDLSPEHHGSYIEGEDNGCCNAGCGKLRRDIIIENGELNS
tara:strand:+ start:22600 stop:22995 length:396 start_codon:yes stop_codon:yes gene_type:complete